MKKCLIVSTVSRQFTLFERGNIEVLKKLGYEIHCVANYEDATEQLKELGIIEHHIDIQRSPFSFKNIKAYKQLKAIINAEKFDLLHCHSPMGGVIARLAARKKRKMGEIKVIYTAHGFHFFKGAPIINWVLYYPIEKWLSRHTDCIITINEEDYNIAKSKFKSKKVEKVRGIGVDKEKFNFENSPAEKHELRRTLDIKDNDFLIIYVAELSKRKNQIMLLKAIKKLKKQGINNIKVLLPGKDSLEGKYQRYVKKNNLDSEIRFLGFRNDIPRLMKISDLYISTSKQEGLPVNIIEAMMCNLPIILTDCRGNRDLLQGEKNASMVKIGNVTDLSVLIKGYINKNIKREYNIEKYYKTIIKEKMEKIYVSITTTKVLHLLSSTVFSGAENVVCQIIKMFREDNLEMIYCSPNGTIKQKLETENIKYMPLKRMSFFYIKNAIKEYAPDIIHAHDIRASIIASIFYKNIKIISHIHGNHDDMKRISLKSILYYIVNKKFSKIFWVSESAKEGYYFKNRVDKKSEVLINVLDRNEIYEKLKKDNNEYEYDVIYLGRLSREKDPLRVYTIMKEVVKKNNRIKCVFVGDGLLKEELKQRIEEDAMSKNIVLKGNIENPLKILKTSKVMIMASKYEGTPMCALEAMALGVPIVSTPTDGLVKIVKNEFNGFLDTEDNKLVLKIEEIVMDTKYREKLSNNSIIRFSTINNLEEYKKRLEKVYL